MGVAPVASVATALPATSARSSGGVPLKPIGTGGLKQKPKPSVGRARTDQPSGRSESFRQIGFWKFLLFSVFTALIYQVFWLKRRREEFLRLDPGFLLKNSYVYAFYVCAVISVPLSIYLDKPGGILDLVQFVAAVNLSWKMLEYLRQVAESRGVGDIKLSKAMAFFFTFFYVEYKIDQILRTGSAQPLSEVEAQ